MYMLKVLKFQFDLIRNHILISALIGIICIIVLYVGYIHQTLTQSVAYLLAMWVCTFIIDAYALWKPAKKDFPVTEVATRSMETMYWMPGRILNSPI